MRKKRNWNCLMALALSMTMLVPSQAVYATEGQTEESGMETCVESRAADADGFEIEDGVLKKYTGTATEVVIPEGVTSIGFGAFDGCSSLVGISIPEGVVRIGSYAFHGCSSLQTVSIPQGITVIGDYVFSGCSGLASISLPEGVTRFGACAFENCISLKEISIPEEVTEINGSAFKGCSSLKELIIPKGVVDIGLFAFGECSGLETIKVEAGNTVYDSRQNCNAVIDTKSNTLILGCQNTVIPEGVTNIGESAFRECISLREIKIPEEVTCIGNYAFQGCSSLTAITIPEGVTSVWYSAFSDCSSLTTIKVEEGNATYDSRGNCNALIETESNTLIIGCQSTIIPEDVTNIGNFAFYGHSGLTEITIPKGVTSIGDCVFARCSNLTSIKVEEGNAVYDSRENCNALIETETNTLLEGCQNTTIPETVTGIRRDAFHGHSNLKEIIIPKGVEEIESETFYCCSSLTGITIPESVTSVGHFAFSGCSSLAEIIIPKGVTSIEDHAFYNCISLNKVIISENVTKIGSSTFVGCNEELTIYGKTGSYAEAYAKENNIKFSSTGTASNPTEKKTISSNNVSLSQYSYTYDGKAKKPTVTVKDGAIVLKEGTDYTVTYSNNINIGTAEVTVTGKGNYTGMVTKEFTITKADPPEQGVKNLSQCTIKLSKSSYAYDGKAKKPAVTVKDGKTVLKEGTDYTVTYSNNINAGTAKVTVTGKGNYKGTVTKSFTITVKKGTSHKVGSYQYKVTGTSTVSLTGVKNNKATKVKILKTVKIGGKDFKVTAIGSRAFKNNKKITSVEIGDNVKIIGTSAFEGCTKLGKATLGKGITEIGGNAFKNCKKLGTVTIKSTKLKKVGKNALKGIKPTSKIKVPAKKLSAYKKLFKNKGQGRKVKIVK